MTKAERARELFLEGCNCAQAVFLAFAEEKLDRETALKIASGFGGGMAGMRDVCGAVSGMFMAYGLLCGPADPTDRAAKTKSYEVLRQLAGEFEARMARSSAASCWASTQISSPSRPNRAPTAITKSARARKWSTARQTFWKPIWPERQKRRPLKIGGIVMAAANWRTLKKLDAHIHILPDAVHTANPDADDVWMYADLRQYVQIMRENHIEQAVIMPFNDPFLMSMEFTAGAVHRNLAEMKRRYPGRFYAFADIDVRNSRAETVDALCRAIDDHALDGIKLHPNNSGLALDSDYNCAIFAFAQERRIPVAVHSYPNAEDDLSAA